MNLDFAILQENWMLALGAHLAGVLVASFLTYMLVASLEKRLVKNRGWPANLGLVRKFGWPTVIFLVALTLGFVPTTVEVPPRIENVLLAIAKFGTILSAMVIVLKVINVGVSETVRQLQTEQRDNLRQRRFQTQIQYVEKLLDLIVIFIALSGIMLSFESFRRLGGSLLASAGLASVILGFSAQRSLGNLIAGFQIAFTQPIRLGDVVLVENEWGEIEEIALTYVVVRVWDLRRLILPITYFLEKPFQNWTRNSSELIGQVVMAVDYSMPIAALRDELTRVLQNSPRWDRRVANLVVLDANDRTLTVRALMSARDSSTTFDLRCEVREALVAFVLKNYPHSLPRTRLDSTPAPLARASEKTPSHLI